MAEEIEYIKVIKGNSSQRFEINYFHQVLKTALNNADNKKYILTPVSFEYSQNRTLRLLNTEDALDASYSMTSKTREQEFIPIKVPLLNSLLGKRRFLVLKENANEFENISLEKLKTKVACQNSNWPDYDILKKNGFNVYGTSDYLNNYKMLEKNRCDYFLRGTVEIIPNFNKMKEKIPNLTIIKHRMISYPAHVYFFVGKHNKKLALKIEKGLNKIKESGQLDKILKKHLAQFYDDSFEHHESFKNFEIELFQTKEVKQ